MRSRSEVAKSEKRNSRVRVYVRQGLRLGEGSAAARALGPVIHAVALDWTACKNLQVTLVSSSKHCNSASGLQEKG
eukprot:2591295-Rhodomonas_salina.3